MDDNLKTSRVNLPIDILMAQFKKRRGQRLPLTNKHNYPNAVVRAVENDPYSSGDSDFTATSLLVPSKVWALNNRFGDKIQEDVNDRIWSLYGQIGHYMIERSNVNDIVEKRLFSEFMGWKVSAQIDNLSLDGGILSDYKFTAVYPFIGDKGPKPEWIAQMNIQLELLRRNNYDVKEIQIVGLLRDWKMSDSERNINYPYKQIETMKIPIWSRNETIEYIEGRIVSHLNALATQPKCSSEETWSGRRCASYCSVNSFCDQYKEKNGK